MNSFLLLREEDERTFVNKYEKEVRITVESRLRTVHFISDILGHFLPRLSDTVTILAGGDVINPEDTYLTIEEKDEPPHPGTPSGDDVVR